jgi:hypothetical protein
MAHYAFLDENNIVTEVIVGRNEDEVVNGISDWETYYGEFRGQVCKRTSYNGNIRKNYAGIGMTYDPMRDAFIAPQPYPSWVLNEDTCGWEAPVAYPTDGKFYTWDEATLSWVEVQ